MAEINVAFHCHSDWSYDGSWTLPELARFFGRRGFDAVMMSEHDTGFPPEEFETFRQECAEASTEQCRLIPGIEYSSPDNDIHILTWGLDRYFKEHQPVGDILDWAAKYGGVAVFAHPVRRDAWKLYDPGWTPLFSGVELWNRKSDGIAPSRSARRMIEETGLPPTLGVDFHILRHYWPLSHRIDVGEDWERDIVEAIRKGGLDLRVFGRRVLGRDGAPSVPLSEAAERGRRALRSVRDLGR